MAIQPIDLQTLFTQVEKIGKIQASQKEGVALQQVIRGVELQRRTDENIQSVNETQDTGQGAEEITDRNTHKHPSGEEGEKQASRDNGKEGEERPPKIPIFQDPALGKYIDFTG
ncbi:MAG: hypothetical protein LBT39_08885 [Treponema sp.]|jgi:hypothetical protein|nr:hypothetical protein [Treponema sp.]